MEERKRKEAERQTDRNIDLERKRERDPAR